MTSFLLLRYLGPVLLMIGYVLYQLLIKKKKWSTVQPDALTCLVFASIWVMIVHWLMN